jgi:uncharacterized membrane protein YfcA
MLHEFLIMLPLSFAAGMVNAAVGGGGLIAVPGLFAVLPHEAPATLFGTDKISAVFGHFGAIRHYVTRIRLPWRLIGLASIAAFVGGQIGARAVHAFPPELIRPLVVVLVAVMLIYTLMRPEFGRTAGEEPAGRVRIAVGLFLTLLLGAYDGFFGPGTGSFLVFLFVRVFRFDFLCAVGCSKLVNLATNSGALFYFVPAGAVLWSLAIPMGISAWIGGLVGAHLVMRGGNRWIRRIFLLLSTVLLIRLGWESFF